MTDAILRLPHFRGQLDELAQRYARAQPFAHIHLPELLDPDAAQRAAAAFPAPDGDAWTQYKHYNENKLGQHDRRRFPPDIARVVDALGAPEFVAFLSRLTGIPDLLADPDLEGGGMHQTERGGFLNVHADFAYHHHKPNWRRRCNLILYLNEPWQDDWGGAIELWDAGMTACVTRIEPRLNHALIFNTTEVSFHGYPDPLRCPADVTRKSLALYYYTLEAAPARHRRATNYRPRPTDSRRKRIAIWLDKKLLAAYSRIKSRLGLSDRFASRLLGLFSRKHR